MGYLRLRDASLPAPRAPRLGRAAAGEGLFNLERKLSTRRSHWTRKPDPDGVSHISLGCNPGNSPGKTNLRSEGTPHSLRVSDIDPGPMPKRRSERRSARRPGSATHGYKRSEYETDGAGGDAATVAGYAGPGFHNWPSGHIPQDNGSESASSHPVPCPKDVRRGVRRGDRGQRPTAPKDPDTKPTAQAATPPL